MDGKWKRGEKRKVQKKMEIEIAEIGKERERREKR